VRVSFERAAVEHFDLVIGAGGLHSSVRTLCFGPEDQYERYWVTTPPRSAARTIGTERSARM
jgi:2-polyprenyl-6-methoxyphenol hydroxylase-like FAD-dependent oxidoreductase